MSRIQRLGSDDENLLQPPKRPGIQTRVDTSEFLGYYQSADADARRAVSPVALHPARKMSTRSSPSEYSPDEAEDSIKRPRVRNNEVSQQAQVVRRRPSLPSAKGADRRRLHIVDMPTEYPTNIPGAFEGLSLVAPPDADRANYLTPPAVSPLSTGPRSPDAQREKSHPQHQSKSSRKITILGTEPKDELVDDENTISSKSPSFQLPQKYSPSTARIKEANDYLSVKTKSRAIPYTPDIGEGKSVHAPVAPPIVTDISSMAYPILSQSSGSHSSTKTSRVHEGAQITSHLREASTHANSPSSPLFMPTGENPYLHYQIGEDATAGPLPPPPRVAFSLDSSAKPPRRPPRLNSPIRKTVDLPHQPLQIPQSIVTPASPMTPQSPGEVITLDTVNHLSAIIALVPQHRREGAQVPSAGPDPIPRPSSGSSGGVDTVFARLEFSPRASLDSDRTSEVRSDFSSNDSHKTKRRSIDIGKLKRSLSRSPKKSLNEVDDFSPSSSPSKTSMLRRFSSLPKRPSSKTSNGSRRTPSPLQEPPLPPKSHVILTHQDLQTQPNILSKRDFVKITCSWPAAMVFTDIHTKKTTMERCRAYSQKINELYAHDSGLTHFMASLKSQGLSRKTRRGTLMPDARPHQSALMTDQPRHVSGSSMGSEFPLRADSYTATDLATRPSDEVVITPPALPYPALAIQSNASGARSHTIPSTSITSKQNKTHLLLPVGAGKGPGFFNSITRKASVRTTAASPTSAKFPPISNPIMTVTESPRAINITTTPSIPGGPRAIPSHRTGRSQTITSPNQAGPNINRKSAMSGNSSAYDHAKLKRRASQDSEAERDFAEQVQKLTDLLPHADPAVLASYLRVTGQDMLAIGLYLEDEKNGTIRM